MEENNNVPEQKTNGLAIAGFVVSLCSLIINLGGLVGLTGTILSGVWLSQVAKNNCKGKGLAIAGLVIGIISIVYGLFSIFTAISLIESLL